MRAQEVFEFIGRVVTDVPPGPVVFEFQVESDFTKDPEEWILVMACLDYHCKSHNTGGGPANTIGNGDFIHFRKVEGHKLTKWRSKREHDAAVWHAQRHGVIIRPTLNAEEQNP